MITHTEGSASKRDAALSVLKVLRDNGFESYFAGGCVRDMMIGREPKDYDVATSAVPADVVKLFKKTVTVGKQFGVVKVIDDNGDVEVTTFREEGAYFDGRRPSKVTFSTAEKDVLRRDFTINGLLYDPLEDRVLDYVGGKKDLAARIVRTIGSPGERFEEDKLRLIRAIRFATQLDFTIEEKTWHAILNRAASIVAVSWERIQDEFRKIIIHPNRVKGLKLLDESGLLRAIMPELMEMKGVRQPEEYHPEGDVWIHTLLTMEKLESYDFETSMGALLHDVGKPRTFQMRDGKPTFYTHEYVGEEMALKVCKRLRLSKKETEVIAYIVRNHLKFKDVMKMKVSTLKRFVNEKHFDRLKTVAIADTKASTKDLSFFKFIDDFVQSMSLEQLKPKPFIGGNDLIRLGMTPGPQFSRIIREVYDRQLEGRFASKRDALAYIKRQYLKPLS